MRDELRNLVEEDYWLYGPSANEFCDVVELIQKYSDYADACVEQMISGADVSPEFAEAHVEVSGDVRYYNYIEKGLLWSFALWRLQGMFEAVLVVRYLPEKPKRPLFGLKAKMDAVSHAGFKTSTADYEDLIAWSKLRNLLSHSPPEHYRPLAVNRADIEEYIRLLKRICASWDDQRPVLRNSVL